MRFVKFSLMTRLIIIRSNYFTAKISTLGAELKSVRSTKGTEFMWQADADIWPRTAPVLFPVVGKVKNDVLKVNGVSYGIGQHGFARDKNFKVIEEDDNHVKLQLIYDDETLKQFPFDFKLTLSYTWVNEELVCSYEVENAGAVPMYFSIGAHPGFNVPEGHFDTYYLQFEKAETSERYLLDGGLFNNKTEPVLNNSTVLPLSVGLFDKDAIVFKQLRSSWIELKHRTSLYSVKMKFDGFPCFGIWAKKGTQRFICLEPWFGHADVVEGHEDVSEKEGILALDPHKIFIAQYGLAFAD